jgi:hypothetical protein
MRKYQLRVILIVQKASYVLGAAIAVASLVPISLLITGVGSDIGGRQSIGTYDNADSHIEDPKGDAQAVYQNIGTQTIPQVRGYHDILGASVAKRDNAFFLTINLAGNPNENENHETLYRWHIITTSQITNREQQYTILFPNFKHGNSTTDGWYFAVYDETVNTYITPMTRISKMPDDRIYFPVEANSVGLPTKFVYWVDVSVRVNATLGEPDYLMDYAPG